MMNDLISRKAAILKMEVNTASAASLRATDPVYIAFLNGFKELFKKELDECKPADAVPVVRCGECEYGCPDDNAFEFDGITPLIRCSYMTEPNRPHEYCSWGRRKESEVTP